uniref:MIP06308p n=1 Tax=Drosophila melanogaster TaxID=7227 RepID=F0JAT1_DROME|nr:uncharacterized protein Dmel_CG42661, isoform A [Drosophila melanogaster]NP_001286969.1 uncharacterized protein Dmel_CG42661, isoform B [Drosophila melanogaster]AOQ15390.1 CG42661-PA [synthetic construct]ADV37498.1 uncharacterized protein Dmel_CG42660, isoform A [Drosophila melanogaster]ADZ17404.1 MIP06308p [Drosophila melanogaster]AHN57994.1 uncharacterized protein Dmel_CG42660, isoform B [Drosophila melanogaster]|eukprot:NP_001189061.1 uncharacterized protein Dmel_CG42661, isoform A [Drosophila melanogaster]
MCFCPTLGLKIVLLLVIPITAGINGAQIAKDVSILNLLKGYHYIMLIISLSLSVVILATLVLLIYAAICNKIRILKVMIFVYVAIVVVKLIILFVCLSTELNPDKTTAHPIFMICWLLTFLCMAVIIIYWLRLHDLANEDN